MNQVRREIKLSFVEGLIEVVSKEIDKYPEIIVTQKSDDIFYIKYFQSFELIKSLRSILRAYLVVRDPKYNPIYISNHKSIIGELVEEVMNKSDKGDFKTYKITCAGSDTREIAEISEYIENTFNVTHSEEADLKIQIIKVSEDWEVGLQITPRPLSLREYKVQNMSGAMDPTVAFSMNYLCKIESARSYLNIFSGSGTLLIEAGQYYPNLDKIVGFDNDKNHLSLSIQNIKKAGLIKKVQVKEVDIFSGPDLGKFDVIVADLPFGMIISKDENLEELYGAFIKYSEKYLEVGGTLAVYTTEFHTLEKAIRHSKFKINKTLDLRIVTTHGLYLNTKIYILSML